MIKIEKMYNINPDMMETLEEGNNCDHQDFKWYHPLVKGKKLKYHEELIVYGKMFCKFDREYMEAPVPYASTCITKDEKITAVMTRNTQYFQTLYISENKGKFKQIPLPKGKIGTVVGGFLLITLNNKLFLLYKNFMELLEFDGNGFKEGVEITNEDWHDLDIRYHNGKLIIYNYKTKAGYEVSDE